ncbi:MAG TPA: hypothetical protein VGR25_11540 [bacterium]|jgi:hypothetical protein|nr:hypothetical protein [bacterium]
MKRVFLALIPVVLMTTASLALPGLTPEPLKIFLPAPAVQPAAQVPAAQPASTPVTTTTAPVVAQAPAPPPPAPVQAPAPATQQSPPTEVAPQPVPLPQLVVDKTQLVEAMSFLVRATEQAKLSVTALDAGAQRANIQETINLLAGSADAHFRQVSQTTGNYPGTAALLSQSLQARETSEATYLAEIQKLSGEVAGAGGPGVPPNVITTLGTRGLRPEEQASQLIERALGQASQALAAASIAPESDLRAQEFGARFASEEATMLMEGVVKFLESALKIVQIAIDR